MSTSIIAPAVVVARPYPGGFMPSAAGSWHRVSGIASSAVNAVDVVKAFPARESVATPTPANRAMNSARLAYDAKQVKGAQPPRGTPR